MSGKVNNQRKQYDLSKLPPGIYLLTLTINKKKETLKFIRR
ncbi:MAG: T9SS type A sorting domain-containing protein [Bacteroidaceae bacterium]|nr:T9SS type A sorting domain-containing protein [Bacteroidaceae bacterium]